jgi:hypothetical protein
MQKTSSFLFNTSYTLLIGYTKRRSEHISYVQGRLERVRAPVQQLFRAPGAWFSNSLELKSHTKFKISKQTLIRVQLKIKELNNFLFFPLEY